MTNRYMKRCSESRGCGEILSPHMLLMPGEGYHSGILAWRIPWTEEPGRLESMGLQRAGHH